MKNTTTDRPSEAFLIDECYQHPRKQVARDAPNSLSNLSKMESRMNVRDTALPIEILAVNTGLT